MKRYIFGHKNVIHIIDLKATLRGIIRAANLVKNIAAQGKSVLLVGTKRQARSVILEEAKRSGMPYVSDRWLGGTLTNFLTIRSRLNRLNELEELEESGRINFYTKKEIARFRRELHKLHRNLSGIREMAKLPGVLVVVDPGREHIAVKEARKLEIPVIGLVDTDTDPELVDIVIPCNDDAFRSISIVLTRMTDSVIEGKTFWEEKRDIDQKARAELRTSTQAPKQRRSRKSTGPPRRRSTAPKPRAKGKLSGAGVEAEKTENKPEAETEKTVEPQQEAKKTEAGTEDK
jgi:small subunit ribosomal protein S2